MSKQIKHSVVCLLADLRRITGVLFILAYLLFSTNAHGAVVSADLEVHLVHNVSTNWQTVHLENTYTDAIPVCSYNLISFSGTNPNYDYPPAVVRIRNITASNFEIRIQGWEDGPAVTGNVHCIVANSGAHQMPDGRKFEAHSVISDKTVGKAATDGTWNQANLEDVSSTIAHSYNNPVVLGQVISYNDSRASVFHTTDCDARANEPFRSGQADGICVGKHIGSIPGSRNPETIGYLVAEQGNGFVNGMPYQLGNGADSISGNNAGNTANAYTVFNNYSVGVVTQVGEDGGDGSWAVLYGADPLPNGQIVVAVDEEIFAGDTTRNHTTESVDYWVFAAAELTLVKKVVNDSGGTATATDFTIGASGPVTLSGITGDTSVTGITVNPSTYIFNESGPAGYTGKWNCVGASNWATGVFVGSGTEVICTLTNDDDVVVVLDATLTLRKDVVNDNGGSAVSGDFTLRFDNGAGITGTGAPGDNAVTNVTVPPGNYLLSESTVPGYTQANVSCDGLDSDGTDGVNLGPGENVTCVFVNDDIGVDLNINKTVSDSSPNVGDTITFTITVTNNGPSQATNVRVLDVVEAGFGYVPASMTGATSMLDSSPAGTGLEWIIANLPTGSSATLTFQATVFPP